MLNEKNIKIEKEVTWENGAISKYFRDPAGNLVEIITPGSWPLDNGSREKLKRVRLK